MQGLDFNGMTIPSEVCEDIGPRYLADIVEYSGRFPESAGIWVKMETEEGIQRLHWVWEKTSGRWKYSFTDRPTTGGSGWTKVSTN